MTGIGDFPFEKVVEICTAREVPVIVDAAAQLPPVDNLWRFTQKGAACAIFSGGKDLHGPQASGLVVGRRWLIDAMRPLGSPNAGIGRPMKVGKEEMAGLLAAVKRYISLDHEERRERDERVVAGWSATLNSIGGIDAHRSFPNEAGQPHPRCEFIIDPATAGLSRDEVIKQLWDGEPRIAVAASGEHGIYLNPMTLSDEEANVVAERLNQILKRG